jgi:hypothetical protein
MKFWSYLFLYDVVCNKWFEDKYGLNVSKTSEYICWEISIHQLGTDSP